MNKNNSDEKEIYQKLIRFGKSKDTPDILIPKVVKYINYPSKKIKNSI